MVLLNTPRLSSSKSSPTSRDFPSHSKMTLKATHSWPVWNWLYNSGGSSNNHDFSGSRRGQSVGTSWPLRTQQLTWLPRLYSLWYVHNKRIPHPPRGRGFKPRYPNYSPWIKGRSYLLLGAAQVHGMPGDYIEHLNAAFRFTLLHCSSRPLKGRSMSCKNEAKGKPTFVA